MAELGAIAETFSRYGAWAIVAVLILTVRTLYTRNTQIQDSRLSDMKELLREGLRAQEAAAHALDKLEDVVKAIKP